MSFTKHLTITVHSLCLIFLWTNLFFFAKNVCFTLFVTNNRVYRSTWVNPFAGNCAMRYQLLAAKRTTRKILWQNMVIFMFKSYCRAQFNQVHSTKLPSDTLCIFAGYCKNIWLRIKSTPSFILVHNEDKQLPLCSFEVQLSISVDQKNDGI